MKGVVTSPAPAALIAAPPVSHDKSLPTGRLRSAAARVAADAWLNLLFWHARRVPPFVVWSKPLWMWGAWNCSPTMRRNTLCNARRLLGDRSTTADRERLARSVIGNFYDFICDVGRSVAQPSARLLDRIESIRGDDGYRKARQAGRGAIIVTAHMGSFEIGIAALLQREKRVHVLFRRDAIGLFERTRSSLRRGLGVVEHCVDDGLAVWMRLREALTADEVVLIQGDRVMPGQKGTRQRFFNGHMLMPTGPVKLALATGAPVIPIFSTRQRDGRIRLFVEEPLYVADANSVEQAGERLTRTLEQYVRDYPEQWLMIHRAWCEDIDRRLQEDPSV